MLRFDAAFPARHAGASRTAGQSDDRHRTSVITRDAYEWEKPAALASLRSEEVELTQVGSMYPTTAHDTGLEFEVREKPPTAHRSCGRSYRATVKQHLPLGEPT